MDPQKDLLAKARSWPHHVVTDKIRELEESLCAAAEKKDMAWKDLHATDMDIFRADSNQKIIEAMSSIGDCDRLNLSIHYRILSEDHVLTATGLRTRPSYSDLEVHRLATCER